MSTSMRGLLCEVVIIIELNEDNYHTETDKDILYS